MSRPFHRRPSSRNCQQLAFGTCTTSRPSAASNSRAAVRYPRGSYRCSSTWNIVIPAQLPAASGARVRRSEERRVWKEGRSRWSPYHLKKKKKKKSNTKHKTDGAEEPRDAVTYVTCR